MLLSTKCIHEIPFFEEWTVCTVITLFLSIKWNGLWEKRQCNNQPSRDAQSIALKDGRLKIKLLAMGKGGLD
jgi:hypothetical protein